MEKTLTIESTTVALEIISAKVLGIHIDNGHKLH